MSPWKAFSTRAHWMPITWIVLKLPMIALTPSWTPTGSSFADGGRVLSTSFISGPFLLKLQSSWQRYGAQNNRNVARFVLDETSPFARLKRKPSTFQIIMISFPTKTAFRERGLRYPNMGGFEAMEWFRHILGPPCQFLTKNLLLC